MALLPLGLTSWERTIRAVELVKGRLLRATAALETASIAYAVIGGNAVAAWVGRVDQSAVRFTQDVDLLIRRSDFDAAKAALETAGFHYQHGASLDVFLDGPDAKAPDVIESEASDAFRVLRLDALVRMKLTSFRDKDRTQLRDMINVGLVDESWPRTLPVALVSRLQQLLDTPDG